MAVARGGHPTGGGGRHPAGGGGGGGTTVVQSPQVLIDRYTKIVLSQPGSVFPLQRLAQLYREKDGNLKGLVDRLREARRGRRGRRSVRRRS